MLNIPENLKKLNRNKIMEEERFSAIFTEGYILRNLIEYLKNTNQSGTFFFSEEKITYRQSEVNKKVVNKVEIRCSDLYSYKFNSNSEISIGVNLQDIVPFLKQIGKKDAIKIFQKSDEPTFLYFQNITNLNLTNANEQNISLIRLQCFNILEFNEPEYSRDEMYPNIVINNQNFTKIWRTFSSMKCENVSIIGKRDGIMLITISKGQFFGRIEKIGNINEDFIDPKNAENHPDYTVITINNQTVKNLSKIGNLSHAQSFTKLFVEKGKPLKIVSNIGTFGKLTVFLYSNN
jgi:hypothetical protein